MRVAPGPRAEEHDLAQPLAVQTAQIVGDGTRDRPRVERPGDRREVRILPREERALGRVVVDELLVAEPFDGPALQPRVGKLEPGSAPVFRNPDLCPRRPTSSRRACAARRIRDRATTRRSRCGLPAPGSARRDRPVPDRASSSSFIQLVAQILEEDVLRSLLISSWRVRRQRGEGAPASEPKTHKALVVLTAPCIGRRAPPANAIMSNVAGTSVHSLGARLLPLLVQYRAAILTLGLIVVACGLAQVTDRLHTAQLQEPAGFAVTPSGDDVARLAPIRVTFATAPSERAPEKLLRLEPAATGSYAWLSPRTLLFQPDFPGLLRGSTYTVKVPARPEAGLPSEITKKFTVTGQLAVQQIIPGDGDTEVPVKAPIIVQFSRSVAPLTTLAAQPTDTVVAFEPALKGKGEWLNTSIYRFIPDALAPATTYKIRIAKGLTSAADGVLKDDFIASFTTIQPGIDSVQPDENWIYAGPWQQVDATFNQPMDRLSVERGFAVRSLRGDALAGKISWNDAGPVLSWNPTQRLAPATKYMVTLERGLKGAHGGASANARTATFTTIPLPSIARTYPGDRERSAARYGVNIQFATPMDPASLEGKLSISGFTAQDLEGRVFTSEMSMGANVTLKPSTFYTVRLAAGATDRYGQPMGGAEFAFTTGALPSSVSFALPGYSTASTVSASSDPIVNFQVTNLPSVSFTLYPLTPDEGRLLLHDPIM